MTIVFAVDGPQALHFRNNYHLFHRLKLKKSQNLHNCLEVDAIYPRNNTKVVAEVRNWQVLLRIRFLNCYQ